MRLRLVRGAGLVLVVSAGMLAIGVPPAAAASPVVKSFSPASGPIGTRVSIKGSGFTGATRVTFNGAASTFTVKSATEIVATVPATASTGKVAIRTKGGSVASAKKFTVISGIEVSSATGPPGDTISVSGGGFGKYEGVDIYFDTTDLALAGTNATGNFGPIAITVPSSALPGEHWVSAEGRHSLLFSQEAYTVSTNWPMFRDTPKHQGFNSTENVLSPSTVSGLDLAWTYPTGGAVNSSPAVVNGVVYVGSDDDNMYALNATTGAKIWSFKTGGAVDPSSPAVVNGVVYVGSDDDKVYALNAATGAMIWSFTTAGTVSSSPTVANGVVYIGSDDDNLYALNASTGAKLWQSKTGAGVDSTPAVANGVVYVGSDDDNVYALNAATGAQIWKFGKGAPFPSSPVVVDGSVLIGGYDDNLYALNASTGGQLGSFATGAGVLPSPAVEGGVIYAGSLDGKMYALSLAGTQLWSFNTEGAIGSSPAVANGVVYVGSANDDLYALSAATGAVLWVYVTGNQVTSSPAVANGMVYVGSRDGNVYAFGLAGGYQAPARPTAADLRPNYSLHMQDGART